MEPVETATVEVVSGGTVAPKDLATLRRLATDAFNQHGKAVKAYWSLCVHIRDAQINPVVVQQELAARGYPPSRVSEIKRVAFCAPALFEEYRKGVVGFRFVLLAARDEARGKDQQRELPLTLKHEEKLKNQIVTALQEIIPVAGPLPVLLRYQFPVRVNGYQVTIKVKKVKPAKPATNAKTKGKK